VIVFGVCAIAVHAGCQRPQADPLGQDAEDAEDADTQSAVATSLLGDKVSGFVTVDPDGNEVDLNQYLGKNVIMLDFWATWCGPCILAMPEVASIAEKYKDRGLVFFAVNVGEDPDSVKEFLTRNNLKIPVAMDFDGKIHQSFNDAGLPHTVVIGKDGRLQVDHLGYWRSFGQQLSDEVGQLLDGKDLVGKSSE
jgi:thiol-disulfide isomerase/thioredoxin